LDSKKDKQNGCLNKVNSDRNSLKYKIIDINVMQNRMQDLKNALNNMEIGIVID